MRITRISIGLDVTVNLGNYENLKPTAVFEAELDRDESPAAVEFQLRGKVQHALAAQLSELLVERAQNGLADCKDLSTAITRTEASPLFKWIVQLDPDEADDLIAAVKSRWNVVHAEPVYVPVDDERPAVGLFDDIGATVTCDDLDELAVTNRYQERCTSVPVGAAADDDPLGEDDFDDDDDDIPDYLLDTEPDDDDEDEDDGFDVAMDDYFDDSDDEDDDDGGSAFNDDDEPSADDGGAVSALEDAAVETV